MLIKFGLRELFSVIQTWNFYMCIYILKSLDVMFIINILLLILILSMVRVNIINVDKNGK